MTARRGPKPRGPFKDKRRTLSTRITEATRSALEQAALASGRSLSQEIEFRLELSLRSDPLEALVERLERVLPAQGEPANETVICLHCNKPFECGPGRVRQAGAKFCCDQHRVTFNSLKRTPASRLR